MAALGVAGCGGGDEGEAKSAAPGEGLKAGDTFKIGYAASQTGRLAIFEQYVIKALKTEVDRINADGGIDGKAKIDLQIRDAKSDPSTGGVVAQELISGGAQLLVTPCDADASLPAAQLAQKEKIPSINSCGSGSSLPAQVGEYAFLNVYGTEVEGVAMAEFAQEQGYKNAYMMTSSDIEYTDSIIKSAAKALESQGLNVLGTENFTLDAPRYTAQATKIANAKPDVVVTSMFLPAIVTFAKNLRAAGYDGPIIGPDGASGPEMFGAGPAAKNIFTMGFDYPSDDPSGERTKAFNELYKKETGQEPNAWVPLGGDIGCLVEYAVKTANSTDPTAVRDALAEAADVPCPSGAITYKDRSGVPKKDIVVLETNTDKKDWEFLKRFFPKAG